MSCQKQDIYGIVHEREITTTKTIIDLRTNPYVAYKHKYDRVSRSEDDCSLYLSGGDLIVFLKACPNALDFHATMLDFHVE